MKEVNLKRKYNFLLILLTFLFWAPSLHRIFQLQDLWICALAWCCQKHKSFCAHTHVILSQHFTNNFSLHTTCYSHATLSWTEKDLRLSSFVPVYQHALSFPVCFLRWGIENFFMVFPFSIKEIVTKTVISAVV